MNFCVPIEIMGELPLSCRDLPMLGNLILNLYQIFEHHLIPSFHYNSDWVML